MDEKVKNFICAILDIIALPHKISRVINLSDELNEVIIKEVENILTELKDAKIYKEFASLSV